MNLAGIYLSYNDMALIQHRCFKCLDNPTQHRLQTVLKDYEKHGFDLNSLIDPHKLKIAFRKKKQDTNVQLIKL